jgi:hypothetical protein
MADQISCHGCGELRPLTDAACLRCHPQSVIGQLRAELEALEKVNAEVTADWKTAEAQWEAAAEGHERTVAAFALLNDRVNALTIENAGLRDEVFRLAHDRAEEALEEVREALFENGHARGDTIGQAVRGAFRMRRAQIEAAEQSLRALREAAELVSRRGCEPDCQSWAMGKPARPCDCVMAELEKALAAQDSDT